MVEFHDYKWMLERARNLLPEEVFEKSVFEIPKVSSTQEGKKTIILNFFEIADVINRPADHLIKYLAKELATAGNVEGRRVIFKGRFSFSMLNKRLEDYVKTFVLCPQCGRHDTKLGHEGRIWVIKCMACGAKEPVKGI